VKTAPVVVVLLLASAIGVFASGTISGRVTSSTTTNGLEGTVLQFYQFEADDFVATATTDAMGNYTSPSLPPGTYALLTQDIHGYINEICVATGMNGCSPIDIKCSSTCDTSSIMDGFHITTNAITAVDFALTPGHRISGTITETGSGPIAGVTVYFLSSDGQMVFSQALTNGMGQYTMDGGTANGNVYVVTANSLGYRNEVYNDHYCQNCDVTAVGNAVVVSNADVSAINFGLDKGGQITGQVTNTTPSPLAGVHVHIIDAASNNVDDATTDAMGNYSTAGLVSGTYYAVTSNSANYADELYNDKLCARGFCDPTQGTAIVVTSPTTTAGINFALAPGGTLTGTVTNANGGAPLHNIFVGIFNSGGTFVGGANTDNSGVYFTIVPTGTYYAAVVNAPGFANQLYDHLPCPGFCNVTTGTQIHITAGTTTGNIDFSLTTGATITGTVTNASNASPIGSLQVQLFSSSGGFLNSVNTDPTTGVYSFTGLAAASYYVRTNSSGAYINLLYNSGGNVVCVQCNVTNSGGSLIVVTTGTTSGINFALSIGGQITGTILKSANNQPPPAGVNAVIVNSSNVRFGSFAANGSGVYLTSGLPAGTYYVSTQNTINFINKLYNNKACTQSCNATAGDPVTVTVGNTTGSIDFSLDLGGSFSGTVTDASTTNGILNATVTFYNLGGSQVGSLNTFNSNGSYTTSGLPVGTYYARVQVNNTGYVGQAYNQKPCILGSCVSSITSTDPIAVTLGTTTPNINFPLTLGGRVSGTVTNVLNNAGISGAQAKIYNSSGTVLYGATITDGAGGYTTGGLPAGTYRARTDATGFNTRVYNNKPCVQPCDASVIASGTPVTVVAGSTTSGVSYVLTPTFTFTDPALGSGTVPIKAGHVYELRLDINLMRRQLGMLDYNFTDGNLAGAVVKALHINELRDALNTVYDALGITRPVYTDAPLTAGTLIKAIHISQIRNAIQAIE
jgi:carboxypeptidase family protein